MGSERNTSIMAAGRPAPARRGCASVSGGFVRAPRALPWPVPGAWHRVRLAVRARPAGDGPGLAALVCLAAWLAFGAGPAAAAGFAVVVNSADASLSLIDLAHQTEIGRIPALREPHHLALTPDGSALLVGDTAGNEMLFLDPATGAVKRRMTIADPYQFGFSPDGKFLVVNGLARNQVDIYAVGSWQLVKRLKLSSMPSHLAFAPDSATVYVTLQGTDRLAAIDLRQMTERWEVEIGKTPAGVLWNRGKLLVGIMGSDYVAVADPADGKVERRIRTGKGAHNLFLSPDGKLVYVGNRVDGTIMALDAATLAPGRSYAVPGGPDCAAFAPDGKMWVTQRWARKVAVLDTVTGAYSSIDVGRSPHGIWLSERAQ